MAQIDWRDERNLSALRTLYPSGGPEAVMREVPGADVQSVRMAASRYKVRMDAQLVRERRVVGAAKRLSTRQRASFSVLPYDDAQRLAFCKRWR